MNLSAPRNMAIFLSILIAFLTGLLTIMFVWVDTNSFFELWIVYVLSVFIIFYVILFYALNNFIIHRIRPIYKIIHQTNVPDKRIREQLENKDIIAVVKDEVEYWAKSKAQEISQLRRMEKYRKEFLGNVSHELKTPVFNIQGYVSTLLDGGVNDPEINVRYLERTEKSINRLIHIINDLESISMLESGELKLKYEHFDIIELAKDVIELYEAKAGKRNIKLSVELIEPDPIIVSADKEKIYEVLSNLVGNSIKYGIEGGYTQLSFLDMDNSILVEVADNGIGIDSTDLPRIFERFYRTDKSRSRHAGGTGLGLAIVKHIIEAHRQTINCRSTLSKGSAFSFTLRKAQIN